MSQIDWEPVLWVGGGFGSVVLVLLGWIAYLQQSINNRLEIRMDKQDARMNGHDEAIHQLALDNKEVLTLLKNKLKIK